MNESSIDPRATPSRLESEIMRRAAGVKNTVIGKAIGHDDGHVSRILSGERGLKIDELEAFFLSLGLYVIESDGDMVKVSADKYAALKLLAREALSK